MKHPLRRALAACCATLLLAGPALAQSPADLPANPSAAAPAAANRPVQFTLDNGLTVIVQPDRRAPTAVHMLWVRVGAMDEVDGTSGVAHALEHMMFKGTAKLGPGEFSRRVAAMGGRENAFTGRDYTGYHQQIPAARLEEVMRLEADRFANNRWADDEFTREIEVVKEERRLRIEDSPRAMLYEVISGTTFLASSYRRPIGGWMSDLHAMTPKDLRDFYRQWYVPGNAAVVVAGDVDPQQVLRLAQKYYGAIPARAVPVRKPRAEPVQAGLRRVEHKAPAEQSYVALSFKVPQLRSFEPNAEGDDALALTVLAAVLDGYSGARLDRGLTQGPDRVADSAGAGNGLWGRGPQLFTLDGVPAPGKTPEQVEAALRAEVARVAREGVSASELQRVKTRWIAAETYKLDSVFNRANELGAFWIWGLPLDAGERLIERLKAVTAEQVQAAAAKYFGDDQLTVGILRPLPRDPGARPRTPAAGLRH
ncbi:MAG TPA: pitrilysin family protein [Ramlibacter sp.]|jgi:zinc protease|uniref:M16 family metallopeptidase n=1 Tax=Ramlibacter sp. TaxID=1917967 RepID=UPI002D4F12C4|nr:pitrilysin family protein [Ramlibacter sp.]HZY19916.1 pitrilysin family protein [Ramlibacter sp.]